MKIISAYPAEIKESSGAFEATAVLYRQAVDYFIDIMLKHRDGSFSTIANSTFVVCAAELLCRPTAKRPLTKYDLGKIVLHISELPVCRRIGEDRRKGVCARLPPQSIDTGLVIGP